MRRFERKRKNFFRYLLFIFSFLILLSIIFFFLLKIPRDSFISPIPKGKIFTFNKDSDPKLKAFKEMMDKVHLEYVSLAPLENSSFLLILKNNEEVVISAKKDFSKQISSLQLIIARSTIEGKRIKRLDFRFDRPVISYF